MWNCWAKHCPPPATSTDKEQTPVTDMRESTRGCSRGETEAICGSRQKCSSLPAPPVHSIHHWDSALFSCSSTSREGWEAPILSWQPSAVHSQSHIITTFIFISIDTRPFPPLKLNQRGCKKGGREGDDGEGDRGGGAVDDEMPA